MDKVMSFITAVLERATFKNVFATLILFIGLVITYTIYEKRDILFAVAVPKLNATGDYPLQPPSARGVEIIRSFIAQHSSDVAIVTIIDSDPVRNMRFPIYRLINDPESARIIEEAMDRGVTGIQPLFNDNASNNKQMLAIGAGEFYCTPVGEGGVLRAFPRLRETIVATCRVPLPPAFGQATGWFSIHLKKWPPGNGLDQLKFDALSMSLAYFNNEIASKGQVRLIK